MTTTEEQIMNDEHAELLKQLMESKKYAFVLMMPIGDINKAVCDPGCQYPEEPHHSSCLHPMEHVRVGTRLQMDELQQFIGDMLADMSHHQVQLVDGPGQPPCKVYRAERNVLLREFTDKG